MADTVGILLMMGIDPAVFYDHFAIRPRPGRHDLHIRSHCFWTESVPSNGARCITVVVMGIFW
ncbi:hypothetical protein SXCC_00534 [Gluconacetobacter sp. SXCC-1]|nr:hypothetical protein SXCC_00534 [Gluconacetobacter sp. SXCC-1]